MPADTAAAASGTDSAPAAPMSLDAAFNAAVEAQGGTAGEEGEGAGADPNAADPVDAEQTSADTLEEGRSDDASEETDEGEEAGTEAESPSPTAATEEPSPKLKKLLEGVPEESREGVRKYIDAAIQPKFQKIAAQTKLLASIERDPVGTAKAIIAEIEGPKGATESPNGQAAPADATVEALKAAGFDEGQIKALAPILQGVQGEIDNLRASEAARVTEQDVEAFKREFPDYDELEPKMNEWFDKIKPADSMDTRQFLGILRTLALGDKAVGDRTKKIFKKVVDNAKAAGPKSKSVPADAVKPATKGPLSWDQSVELASQGVTVGRGLRR